MMVTEFPDAAPVNGLKGKKTAAMLPPNCFHVQGKCCCHVYHLIVEDSMEEKLIIGDMHAVQFVTHLSSHFNRLIATARDALFQNMQLKDGPMPLRLELHIRAVLQHTVRQFDNHTRSRLKYSESLSDPSVPEHAARNAERTDKACDQVVASFRGDIRSKTPEYYLDGREGEPQDLKSDIADEMTAAALNAGFLEGTGDTLLAANRWGTCAASAARMGGGFMFFDILGSALHHTYSNYSNNDPGADFSDDFRQRVKGKSWRALKLGEDEQKKEQICCLLWTTFPLDHVWRVVQHGNSSTLGSLDTDENPFRLCGASLAGIFLDPSDLHVFAYHFGKDDPATELEIMERSLAKVLNMAAHNFWRLDLKLDVEKVWPYKWLKSDASIYKQCYEALDCDIDDDCTKKARDRFPDEFGHGPQL
jgi:hypothetical protein